MKRKVVVTLVLVVALMPGCKNDDDDGGGAADLGANLALTVAPIDPISTGEDEPTERTVTVFYVGDTNNLVYKLVNSAEGVYSARLENGKLLIEPAPDQSGNGEVTIEVTDGTEVNSIRVLVTVMPVNDAPRLLKNSLEVTFDEDTSSTGESLDELVEDPETPDSELEWTVSSDQVMVTIDPATRMPTYSAPENWWGEESVLLTVRDGEGVEDLLEVQVTVAPVNDPPTLSTPVEKITIFRNQQFSRDLAAHVGDPDLPDDSHEWAFTQVDDAPFAQVVFSENMLTIDPTEDVPEGIDPVTTSITLSLKDMAGESVSQEVPVEIVRPFLPDPGFEPPEVIDDVPGYDTPVYLVQNSQSGGTWIVYKKLAEEPAGTKQESEEVWIAEIENGALGAKEKIGDTAPGSLCLQAALNPASGLPAVVFPHADGLLKLRELSDSGWESSTISDEPVAPRSCSLVYQPGSGCAAVAYPAATSLYPTYAIRCGSEWSTTVLTDQQTSTHVSLGFLPDSNGKVVAYQTKLRSSKPSELRINGFPTVNEDALVDAQNFHPVGGACDMKFDSQSTAHIVHFERSSHLIKHSYKPLDDTKQGWTGGHISKHMAMYDSVLALSEGRTAVIFTRRPGSDALVLAERQDQVWDSRTILTGEQNSVGQRAALVLNAENRALIAFWGYGKLWFLREK